MKQVKYAEPISLFSTLSHNAPLAKIEYKYSMCILT